MITGAFLTLWRDATSELSEAEKGRLADAIAEYESGREWEPYIKGRERLVFPIFRRYIDRRKAGGVPYGQDHWNWKGGKTPENQRQRNCGEYANWRREVFKRDDYTCQLCGARGGKLNAHHIEPWATNLERRFDIDNGITLCEKCHKGIHGR